MSQVLFRFLPALILFALWSPACGQGVEMPASLWLHAWVPETGAIASSAGPLEKSLARVAELARRGDFTHAFNELDAVRSSEASPEYLIKIFRRELLIRSTQDIGGATDQQGDGGLIYILHAQEADQLTREAVQLASLAGPFHQQQLGGANYLATFYDTCAIQMVTNLRINQLSRETSELKTLAAAPQPAGQGIGELGINCGLMSLGLQDSQMADPVSLRLLRLLTEARYEAGRWNYDGAKGDLMQGLALARSSRDAAVVGLWLLALGDLEVALYGSPLTFGLDSTTDSGVRSNMSAGVYSRAMAMPTPEAIARAEDYYRQSNRPEAELAIRKAYIAWLRKGRDSASDYAAAAVAAWPTNPALQALALCSQGLLLANKQYYETGLSIAKKSGFSGLVISLVDMADSVASRLTVSDPARALKVLEFAALVSSAQGFPASASRLELSLAFDNNAVGRPDFAIDAWERAIDQLQTWLRESENTTARHALSSPLLPGVIAAQRHRLMGVLVQLAGALNQKYYTEGREEWRDRRDDYEAQAQKLMDGTDDFVQESWAQYLKSRDSTSALAKKVMMVRAGGCDAAREAYQTAKNNSAQDPVALAAFAAPVAACDPALREDAVRRLSAFDPIGPLQVAIEISAKQPGFAAAQQLQAAVGNLGVYHDGLVSLRAGSKLLNEVSRLESLVRANPTLIGRLAPYVELYRAIAFGIEGRNAESRDLLLKLRAGAFGSAADPGFRRRIDAVLIEACAALEDPAGSLLALEALQSEGRELQTFTSGVRAGDPDSVRLAMLLRQQAISEIPPGERQEIVALEARLRPDTAAGREGVANVGSITDQIPEGVVVLAYYAGRAGMLIWRLERGKTPVLRSSNATVWAINQAVADFSGKLLDRMEGWEPVAAELYRALVEPIGLPEPGVTLAIFGMSSVPFDLLSPIGGRSLVKDYPIVYVGDLSSPNAAPKSTAGTTSVVIGAMGASLSQVDAEAAEVAQLLHTHPLPAPQGTVNGVLAVLPSARFVHIASHGVIDPVNPYRSYLALKDGNLEAWELFHSARQADLVVFSACDTLRPIARSFGEDQTTIAGLTALGGSARVLSSLWVANDSDARQLMGLFYERLGTNPAIALQKAKVALGQVYRSSNFVLTVQSPSAIILNSTP